MADPDLLDLGAAREVFEASKDFTIGLEEEFAILDPATLDLADRFPELYEAAQPDPVGAGRSRAPVAGRRGDDFAGAGQHRAPCERHGQQGGEDTAHGARAYCAVHPPSIDKFAPVIDPAESPLRYSASPATSSGTRQRP